MRNNRLRFIPSLLPIDWSQYFVKDADEGEREREKESFKSDFILSVNDEEGDDSDGIVVADAREEKPGMATKGVNFRKEGSNIFVQQGCGTCVCMCICVHA